MKKTIRREVKIALTTRARQMMGMFDVAPAATSVEEWEVDLDLPAEWSVGVIVGPSGSGKSTIAREFFGKEIRSGWKWPRDKSILDGFPSAMPIKEITALLSSVGFSSPPAWLRPFHVLSTGQQFRVNVARTLAETGAGEKKIAVVDEFTSVVDRDVAKIGSAAVAKTVRRRGQKFIAVTCHYDVLEWLEPDWVYEVHTGKLARGRLRLAGAKGKYKRPGIELEIARVDKEAWELFKSHHYLTASIHRGAVCFCAFIDGRPVAFDAWLPFVGKLRDSRLGRRGHRTVCLPDFQGVGIGAALFNHNAQMWAGLGYRVFSCTGHPAEIKSRLWSGIWKMTRKPSFTAADTKALASNFRGTRSSSRLTASFEYVGPAMERKRAMRCLNG